MNMKFEKTLKGKLDTKVVSYQVVDNDKGGYCQLVLSTPIRKEYKVNIFPSNLNYWANSLAVIAQIDTDDFEEILNKLIEEQIVFPLYYGLVSFSADGRRFTNGISFNEPTNMPETVEEIASII